MYKAGYMNMTRCATDTVSPEYSEQQNKNHN